MQQDDSVKTSKDDPACSDTSEEALETVRIRRTLDWHPWLREYFEVQCRAKKVVDANPDLYPVTDLDPRRRHTSRKLNMTPAERKRLVDGIRTARREIRASYDLHMRRGA